MAASLEIRSRTLDELDVVALAKVLLEKGKRKPTVHFQCAILIFGKPVHQICVWLSSFFARNQSEKVCFDILCCLMVSFERIPDFFCVTQPHCFGRICSLPPPRPLKKRQNDKTLNTLKSDGFCTDQGELEHRQSGGLMTQMETGVVVATMNVICSA